MIWIIGSNGLLGREVCNYLAQKGFHIVGTDKEVDILSPLAMERHIENFKPRWIINCSGYKDLDGAEGDWDQAFMINKEGTASIAYIAQQLDIPLIHISTDRVFDGTSKTPVTENVEPKPLSVYGASKLAGEEAIRSISSKHFIIRTSWLFGEHGKNTVFTLLNKMENNSSCRVPHDRTRIPTWTRDVAEVIEKIISENSRKYGTYHFSSDGECTIWEFAWEVYIQASRNGLISNACSIIPGKAEEVQELARRPEYMVLSNEKIKNTLNHEIPMWEDSLDRFIQSLTPELLSKY